jgi:hypothetical protein
VEGGVKERERWGWGKVERGGVAVVCGETPMPMREELSDEMGRNGEVENWRVGLEMEMKK